MKTSLDPRHLRREEAIKGLFEQTFGRKPKNDLAREVFTNSQEIDEIIVKAAPEWPISQINRIDLAILRLAIHEMVIVKKEPPKVIIDEAVELAKSYGSEKSPGFINGVLGTVLKSHDHEKL